MTDIAVDESNSILNYAEAPRIGDWTLRSALVRLAQPHPLRSEAVLQLVRRLDAAIKPIVRELQQSPVVSSRSIPDAASDIVDVRLVEVAVGSLSVDSEELTETERSSVQLIELALELDHLANTLAGWANNGPSEPPLETIDQTCARVLQSMNDHGVPEEPQWDRGRPSGRGV